MEQSLYTLLAVKAAFLALVLIVFVGLVSLIVCAPTHRGGAWFPWTPEAFALGMVRFLQVKSCLM